MATITVDGGDLQAAINSAQNGDTLDVKPGTYGKISIFGKPLTLIASDGATIAAPSEDGHVVCDIDRAKVIMRGFTYAYGGCGVRFTGDCSGSEITDFRIGPINYLVRNTPSPGNDDYGGNAFILSRREGQSGAVGARGILIADGEVRNARGQSFDYGTDGGFLEVYGGASDITVRDVEVWDSVNIFEAGKGSEQPDNANILIEGCTFHGRPDPSTEPVQATVANGLFIRAVDGLTVSRCEFDRIDWWCHTLISSGGFAGGIQRVTITDNVFRLMPGVSRTISIDGGIDVAQVTMDRNHVYVTGSTRVAELSGVRYMENQREALVADTGWEANSYWGREEDAPDPEPEPEPDCSELEAQVAELTARVAELEDMVEAQGNVIAGVHQITAPIG